MKTKKVSIQLEDLNGEIQEWQVPMGTNLRQAILDQGLTPYTSITQNLNCGGRGLCATCGVWVMDELAPVHWHDKAADRFGYPRLSCQITLEADIRIRLVDKWIWGGRKSRTK